MESYWSNYACLLRKENFYYEENLISISKYKLLSYTTKLADKIEDEYSVLFNGKIDRRQLYAEIKFHIVCWDSGIGMSRANPANIEIYYNGEVKDSRDWLNRIAKFLYGGEYG